MNRSRMPLLLVLLPLLLAPAPVQAALPGFAADTTDAEHRVRARLAEGGVHVVHFWAPWCRNSTAELRNGWYALVERNPDVTFTFVTVWNDGASGAATLARYAIPERVLEVPLPDYGPSAVETQRRQTFLDRPLRWIPATWIYRDGGALAFALDYGEMEMDVLQQLLDAAARDWRYD